VVVTITFDPAVTSFSGSFTLDAPVEDSDVDLGTISIVANVQDQVDNSETNSANSSLQIDVDAVLDEALDPGADSDVDEVETAAPQTVNLGLLATLGSAGFVNDPPVEGDSGSGGSDGDGSELISVVLVLDNLLPAGVTLSSTDGTVTQDLVADPSGQTYVITGADLAAAIDGLQVELPGSFEGSITGTVTVTSMEANTPPGDVVPASGEEPDTSDNVVVLSADFDVTVEEGADPTGDELSLTVDEAALDLVQDGSDLAAGTTFGNDAASTAETDSGGLTFNAGADPIVDIYFGGTGGIVVVDEDGNPIPVVWSGTGTDTLTGTLNGVTVIVLSLSGDNTAPAGGTASVTVTATLTDAFPHDFGNTGDVTITGIEVDAEDDDGDTGTSFVDVTVLDDVPNDISPDAAVIGSGAGSTFTGDLDFFDNVGADKPGDVVFDPALDDTQLMSGGVPVTSNGDNIFLEVSLDGHTLTGWADVDGSGTINAGDTSVFTIVLQPDAVDEGEDEYIITLQAQIDTGAELVFDDFSAAPAGQNDWVGLDSDGAIDIDLDNNDSQDLLITPTNVGGTVNTDNDDMGNGSQWIDPGEGLRIDFVVDVARLPGQDEKDANGWTHEGHYTSDRFKFTVMQTQGGGTAAVLVSAFLDADLLGELLVGDGSSVMLSAANVIVTDENGVDVTGSVTITQSGNSVIVEGVEAQWQILVIGDSAFNSIEIENADGIGGAEGDDFVIGEYVVSAEASGEPVDLSFDVDVVDEDGDASDGTIDVTVLPQQVAGDGGATLTAGVNGGDLVGGDGNDSLIGSDADDKLQGGLGNDTIGDGAGNDLIIGGDGADVINLAADNVTDVLEYNDLSEGGDTVNGFDTDAPGNGDIIDLVDLLDGGSFTGTTLGEAIADGYVNLDDSGPDLLVQVDLNGGADSFSTIVTIAGIGAGNEALVTDNIVVD